MKYYLDDTKIRIYPTFYEIIGRGIEGKVYKCGKYALKVYHEDKYNFSLNKEVCDILKKLDTTRILLPKHLLLGKNKELEGYATLFIKKRKYVYKISKKKLIYELNKLENELYYLARNHISVNDWSCSNFRFDGKFRFVDPGMYNIEKDRIKKIRKFNYCILKEFIFFELLQNRVMGERDDYKYFINQMYRRCGKVNISGFFQKEMNDKETLNQYIKRITHK